METKYMRELRDKKEQNLRSIGFALFLIMVILGVILAL